MSKQPDFGNDLAALNDNVTAAVDDVLQALQQKRSTKQPMAIQRKEALPADAVQPTVQDLAVKPEPATASNAPRRQRFAGRSKLAVTIEEDEPLDNVTTRLRRSTNALLTEVALRQRLKKVAPDSRQAIIEAALHDWYRKHNYRSGDVEGES